MADATTTPPPVVTGEALRARFRDYDSLGVYEEVKEHALSDSANNFVVKFGAGSALVALDLNSFEFDALLRRDHFKEDEETPIRWM